MRCHEIYNACVMTGVFIMLKKEDVNSKLTKKHVKLALANNKLLAAADKNFHYSFLFLQSAHHHDYYYTNIVSSRQELNPRLQLRLTLPFKI